MIITYSKFEMSIYKVEKKNFFGVYFSFSLSGGRPRDLMLSLIIKYIRPLLCSKQITISLNTMQVLSAFSAEKYFFFLSFQESVFIKDIIQFERNLRMRLLNEKQKFFFQGYYVQDFVFSPIFFSMKKKVLIADNTFVYLNRLIDLTLFSKGDFSSDLCVKTNFKSFFLDLKKDKRLFFEECFRRKPVFEELITVSSLDHFLHHEAENSLGSESSEYVNFKGFCLVFNFIGFVRGDFLNWITCSLVEFFTQRIFTQGPFDLGFDKNTQIYAYVEDHSYRIRFLIFKDKSSKKIHLDLKSLIFFLENFVRFQFRFYDPAQKKFLNLFLSNIHLRVILFDPVRLMKKKGEVYLLKKKFLWSSSLYAGKQYLFSVKKPMNV